ncbi:XVIPCD domain-containing protein [Lysobacter sp. HA18]
MPFDQQRYEQLRADLVDRNEANVGNIYLDVLGIPTVGIGVALTARQADRLMALDANHITALGDVVNLDAAQRQQLAGLLQSHLAVQNQHIDERHNSLRDFLASDFGQSSQQIFGTLVNTRHVSPSGSSWSWDVLTSADSPMQVQLTHEQSIALFNRVAPEYEGRLTNTLRRAHCPAEALSEEQRAAIFSMVYQGASGKAQRTADAIGDYWRGELNEDQLRARLRTAVSDPAFAERSRNELAFLEAIEPRPAMRTNGAQAAQGHPGHAEERPRATPQRDRPLSNAIPPIGPEAVLPQAEGRAPASAPEGTQHSRSPDRSPTGAPDPLHRQAEAAVRSLDASMGKTFDGHSQNMAARLACLAKENGFDRIDHVVLSDAAGSVRKGENVFVVQGGLTDATNRVAHMKTQDAITAPVHQSLQQLAATAPAQTMQTQHLVQDAATRQPSHRMTV